MAERKELTGLLGTMWRFNDWIMHRVPGGAGLTRPRYPINLHKFSVGPLTLALMFATDNFSLAAWLYLALHGTYGLMWVAKDVAFGDASWRGESSIGSAVVMFCFLAFYYVPVLVMLTPLGEIIPGRWGTTEDLPLPVAFAAVVSFIVGAFFHFVSDAQKYFVLEHQQPRQLITTGMFALTRNPNYLGEILMYAAFCLLAQHWAPWVACGWFWLQLFVVNMLAKDASMSRYPEHAEWKRQTGMLLPHPITLLRKLPLSFRDG